MLLCMEYMKWKPVTAKDDTVARNEELIKIVKKGKACVMVSVAYG